MRPRAISSSPRSHVREVEIPQLQHAMWMMHKNEGMRFCSAWAVIICMISAVAMAGDWPAFRGPDGNGVALEEKAPLRWSQEKNVRWKSSLPGPGNSSPIVSRGRVFVTCAEDAGNKRNLYCFDRRTGEKLWTRTVEFPNVEPTHRSNPYCASTPGRRRIAGCSLARLSRGLLLQLRRQRTLEKRSGRHPP